MTQIRALDLTFAQPAHVLVLEWSNLVRSVLVESSYLTMISMGLCALTRLFAHHMTPVPTGNVLAL